MTPRLPAGTPVAGVPISYPSLRQSAVVTSTSSATPTVIITWPGPGSGLLKIVYVNSLDAGDEEVSLYVLPFGVTAGADAYLISPKNVDVLNKDALILDRPIILSPGESLAVSSTNGSRVMCLADMEVYTSK